MSKKMAWVLVIVAFLGGSLLGSAMQKAKTDAAYVEGQTVALLGLQAEFKNLVIRQNGLLTEPNKMSVVHAIDREKDKILDHMRFRMTLLHLVRPGALPEVEEFIR